ncbi:LysR substrate-binding domain-containing protein [Plastoroseomonas hellenica]|uniref:LysR substrate-binding domain-containing protein n=1 Tax=Plastoroseomonas hellenica TaxID=2687306 RepID=UPI001BA4C00B|nr:LysR substrate-binding domain-containing protein [Plastoroseomonas hellenica]MBR0645015.1 LysR family transcriptional regulator [Plastoroseomonas hellenica]
MPRTLPPLDSLWAFHTIAETGSVTAAAAELKVTQPAVSRRLRELEAALGCALVRRGPNAISLTDQGKRFARELRQGFAQLQAATRNLQAQNAPLRIRAYTTWALRWLIPRLPRFEEQNPGIDVEVSTSTAVVDLVREGVDAAIKTAPVDHPPSPKARRLQPVMIAPFAAPKRGNARRAGASVQGRQLGDRLLAGRLPGDRLLGSKVRAGDWAVWQRHAGLPPAAPPLLFESTTLAIQAALEGLGTVICSPAFVQEEVHAGRLVALSETSATTGDCYWLILPEGRVSPALRIFTEWLMREAAAEDVVPTFAGQDTDDP